MHSLAKCIVTTAVCVTPCLSMASGINIYSELLIWRIRVLDICNWNTDISNYLLIIRNSNTLWLYHAASPYYGTDPDITSGNVGVPPSCARLDSQFAIGLLWQHTHLMRNVCDDGCRPILAVWPILWSLPSNLMRIASRWTSLQNTSVSRSNVSLNRHQTLDHVLSLTTKSLVINPANDYTDKMQYVKLTTHESIKKVE